ncbi:MAG: response regulator transcription factor [Planctomycetota bacterium]
MDGSTRVVVADPHAVVRLGVAAAVEAAEGLAMADEAGTIEQMMKAMASGMCDVLVTELSFQGLEGLEAIKTIKARHPMTGVLVFTAQDELLFAERSIGAGARGYLMKSVAASKLIDGIRAVARGKVAVSPAVAQRMMASGPGGVGARGRRSTHGIDSLSDRELEVLSLLGAGQPTREIAKHLHLSVKTIDTYRDNLKHKLGLDNATQLIRYAVRFSLQGGASS